MIDRAKHRGQMVHVKFHGRLGVHKAGIGLDFQRMYIEPIYRVHRSHLLVFYLVLERYRAEIPQDEALAIVLEEQLQCISVSGEIVGNSSPLRDDPVKRQEVGIPVDRNR